MPKSSQLKMLFKIWPSESLVELRILLLSLMCVHVNKVWLDFEWMVKKTIWKASIWCFADEWHHYHFISKENLHSYLQILFLWNKILYVMMPVQLQNRIPNCFVYDLCLWVAFNLWINLNIKCHLWSVYLFPSKICMTIEI